MGEKLIRRKSKVVFDKSTVEALYRTSFDNNEFYVYYQPKINLKNYSLAGAEALVRWNHEGDLVIPDKFIPVLEENGAIKDLDYLMLKKVCDDVKLWLERGKKVPQISVNLSRTNLVDNEIAKKIISVIDEAQIGRKYIQIELTESAGGANPESLKNFVWSLHEAGISTAVDDFGTGFSSLSLIRELPWDALKIDRSLLEGAQIAGSREQLVYKSIISLAHGLGLECITEGVETKEQVSLLKESECYLAQGFFFDRPLPAVEFEKRL